jgi:SAM-dependent methyltransferase
MEEWTGEIHRPLRVWQNPKPTDDIYLHFSEVLKAIKKYAPKMKGNFLDVGAGKTPYKKFFKFDKYTTLDNRKYPGIDIAADITKPLPLKKDSFDSVVCIQVLEHVNKPQNVVDGIHKVLKKGGACLLTTHMAVPLHGEPYDYYRFTKYGLKDIFKKFSKVEVIPNGGAALSIMQFIVWGVAEKLPKPLATPVVYILNKIGETLDKLFYSEVLTINYAVYAIK